MTRNTGELKGFTSETYRTETKACIGKKEIKGIMTNFKPLREITLEELLNELGKGKGTKKKYISINYNNSKTDLKEITDIEDLKKYFKDEISALFSIEDKYGEIYYDIKVKPNKVKEAQQKFKKFKLTNPTEPEKGTKQYSITPKNNSQFTINDVIADIKKISDEKTQIYINSPELEDTGWKNINEIPKEYFNLVFRGGNAIFKKEGSYYYITGYTKDNLTSRK